MTAMFPGMDIARLQREWQKIIPASEATARASAETFSLLRQLYSEPHRAYHNLSHVESLLALADSFQAHFANSAAVRFAIWFHDAIYNPHSNENEQRSAELAVEKLPQLMVDENTIGAVREMILATRAHQTDNNSNDLKLFLDLDLSILGAVPEIYQSYSTAIRQEYSWVPGFLYRRKRKQILTSFLQRPMIYYSDLLREKFEVQARINLKNELDILSN
jgi:predicted metal-dependent HD superfamily phosphohydrolase